MDKTSWNKCYGRCYCKPMFQRENVAPLTAAHGAEPSDVGGAKER